MEFTRIMDWGKKNGPGEEFTGPKLVSPEAYAKLTHLQSFRELVDYVGGSNLYDKNPSVNVDVNSKSTVGDEHLDFDMWYKHLDWIF